jgi:glycogen operon protein
MFRHGDELGHSQHGNNNPYCQDNELTWLDWTSRSSEEDLTTFVREVLEIRRTYPALRCSSRPGGEAARSGIEPESRWLHPEGRVISDQDWADPDCLTAGLYLPDRSGDRSDAPALLLLLNARSSQIAFRLPVSDAGGWRRLVDTAAGSRKPVDCRGSVEMESLSAVLLAADGAAPSAARSLK